MRRERVKAWASSGPVVAWLAWFAVLNVLWLVFISAWVPEEEVLGLSAAAVGATAAEAVREQGVADFRFRLRWLWVARVLPWRSVRETGIVIRELGRRVWRRPATGGGFRVVRVSLPHDRAEQAAKRALLTIGESFAPNAFVITIDNQRRLMLMHELAEEQEAE